MPRRVRNAHLKVALFVRGEAVYYFVLWIFERCCVHKHSCTAHGCAKVCLSHDKDHGRNDDRHYDDGRNDGHNDDRHYDDGHYDDGHNGHNNDAHGHDDSHNDGRNGHDDCDRRTGDDGHNVHNDHALVAANVDAYSDADHREHGQWQVSRLCALLERRPPDRRSHCVVAR